MAGPEKATTRAAASVPSIPSARMHIRDFDYDLPADLIAQEPTADRGGARLLHLSRSTATISHTQIAELPSLLSPATSSWSTTPGSFPPACSEGACRAAERSSVC